MIPDHEYDGSTPPDSDDPYQQAVMFASLGNVGSTSFQLDDESGVQDYVDRVTASEWWLQNGGPQGVLVRSHDFDEPAEWGRAYVEWDGPEGTPVVHVRRNFDRLDSRIGAVALLHELAHILSRSTPPHDLEFIKTWIRLLTEYEGDNTGQAIRHDLQEQGVPL
jgi:hypothetical protein